MAELPARLEASIDRAAAEAAAAFPSIHLFDVGRRGFRIEELKGLAATKGVELSAVIDPKHADTFQSLEKSSGAEFDKEFLAAVVSGHKKCVSNFETASTDAKDADVKAWAAKMLPGLKAHLEKAKDLQAKEVSAK